MPEYRTYGEQDDKILEDLDMGYTGFNDYLRPDQLQRGILATSNNGRLGRNGEWQVRPGIDLVAAPFASGDDVLRLPTTSELQAVPSVVGLLPTTIRRAEVVNNVMELFLDPLSEQGHDFTVGEIITVEGLEFASPQSDPNGTFVVVSAINGTVNQKVKVDFIGIDTVYRGPVVLPIQLPFNLTLKRGSAVAGYNMLLDQGGISGVYASTAYSNPNDSASQWVLLGSNVSALAINLADPTITYDLPYKKGETAPPLSDMIQAFNKVFLFRNGQTALEWDGIFSPVAVTDLIVDGTYSITDLGDTTQLQWNTIAGTSGVTYAVNDTITVDAVGTGTGTARSGFTPAKSGQYTQPVQIDCLPGEFAITNSIASVSGSHDVKVGDDITVMSPSISGVPEADSGLSIGQDYVVNKVYELGEGVANINGVSNDGLQGPGDFEGLHKYTITTEVVIMDGWTPNGTAFNGSFFVQGVPDSFNFVIYTTFNVNATDVSYTNARAGINSGFQFVLDSRTVITHINDGASLLTDPIFTKRVSVGLGFTHMPAPPYATYHQRRLVMPYRYSVDDSEGQYTVRDNLDEIIVSDILDSDTYDQIYNQYRFNAGTADFNVGLLSFADDKLVVFNRNSIHLVGGSSPANSSVELITNEVGCLARRTIVQIGNNVMFLSDNGVYGANFQDLYNLRGSELPLSSSIQTTIDKINRQHWDQSVAVYFNNRYYIAVPIDGSTVNNTILIFNFINKQWESVDTTSDVDWDIENLIIAGKKSDRAVYAVNALGGLHRVDARPDGVDRLATTIPVQGEQEGVIYSIPAEVTTRQFTLNDFGRKRWNEFEMHVQSSNSEQSDFDLSAEVENIDAEVNLNTLSSYIGGSLDIDEDVSVRGRIGNRRGYGIQFTINNTQGRPRVRGIKVSGAPASRSTTSVQ
jgi:hypothetical protein